LKKFEIKKNLRRKKKWKIKIKIGKNFGGKFLKKWKI